MIRNAIVFLLLAPATSCVAAGALLDVQAGALYDSNLSRAQLAHDIKSDTAVQSSLAWGRFVPLPGGFTLRATLDGAGEIYTRYSGLDNLALGGSLGVRRKFGLGAFAPWISVAGSAARLEYRNSVRDGWRYEAGLGGGKRLTESWDVAAGLRYAHRTADREKPVVPGISGAVFDLQSHTFAVRSEHVLTGRVSLAAGYDYRRGDIASTTLRNFTVFTHSDAIAVDTAFGDDTVGYRIYAVTRAWRLGLSYALGQSNSINVLAERWTSRARGGLDYYNTLFGATYVHAF